MAWLESHQSLRDHPKTKRAAHRLEITVPTLIGHLQLLWWWSLDYAQDGDLSDFDSFEIADAAGWDGDPDEFVQQLIDCGPGDRPGFLERDGSYGPPDEPATGALVIHDWWEYAGKLIAKRQADAARKREGRNHAENRTSDERPKVIHRTSNGHLTEVAGTVQYRTQQYSTEPERGALERARPILHKFGLRDEQIDRSLSIRTIPDPENLEFIAEKCSAFHASRGKKIKDPYLTWLSWLEKHNEFYEERQSRRLPERASPQYQDVTGAARDGPGDEP